MQQKHMQEAVHLKWEECGSKTIDDTQDTAKTYSRMSVCGFLEPELAFKLPI